MRKKWLLLIGAVVMVGVCLPAGAGVGNFLADTNQFGYQGTVTNVTDGTGSVAFPTPRDGVIYFTRNVPLTGYTDNYSAVQSTWYQHPLSNQNPGFFQINDGGTITSATGGWTQNGSLWDFALTVTGENATYANSYSRLWQPDYGDAWGGTFSEYTYTITATGMPTTVTNGWRINTADPTGITGSFDGTFFGTQYEWHGPSDMPPRDTYVVHLDFNKTYWDSTEWSDTYDNYYYGNYSTFGAPVPEPLTVASAFAAVFGLGAYIRRRTGRVAA